MKAQYLIEVDVDFRSIEQVITGKIRMALRDAGFASPLVSRHSVLPSEQEIADNRGFHHLFFFDDRSSTHAVCNYCDPAWTRTISQGHSEVDLMELQRQHNVAVQEEISQEARKAALRPGKR